VKQALVGALAAAAVATSGLVLNAGSAQAQASDTQHGQITDMAVYTQDGRRITGVCQPWQDNYTFGVRCNTAKAYYAWAKCRNGRTVTGVVTNSNRWSYAYCTSVGSSLYYGKGKWAS
jgi:hypothetical protein